MRSNDDSNQRELVQTIVRQRIVELGKARLLMAAQAGLALLGVCFLLLLFDPKADQTIAAITSAALIVWGVYVIATGRTRRIRLGYWLTYQDWADMRRENSRRAS